MAFPENQVWAKCVTECKVVALVTAASFFLVLFLGDHVSDDMDTASTILLSAFAIPAVALLFLIRAARIARVAKIEANTKGLGRVSVALYLLNLVSASAGTSLFLVSPAQNSPPTGAAVAWITLLAGFTGWRLLKIRQMGAVAE